jgi:hypothetical protein
MAEDSNLNAVSIYLSINTRIIGEILHERLIYETVNHPQKYPNE